MREKFSIILENRESETLGKYISVNVTGHNRGMVSPCKSRTEVLSSIRGYLFDGNNPQKGDILFKDLTNEHFSINEIFGTYESLLGFLGGVNGENKDKYISVGNEVN